MSMILNIETATDICSVCLADNSEVLAYRESTEAYSHSKVLTILIDECIQEAGVSLKNLDAVAVSTGPGSYTALRVGTAVAKGICYALEKPLIAVDTLTALAQAAKVKAPDARGYVAMIDARRMEVYAAVFDHQLKQLQETTNIILEKDSFDTYFSDNSPLAFCGNGAPKSQELFASKDSIYTELLCDARHMISLSEAALEARRFEDIAYYAPIYFKAPNITKSKKIL